MSEQSEAEIRYEAFVEAVSKSEMLWTLENDDGFVLMCDDEGRECLPFWPDEQSCAKHISDDWKDCLCQAIPLEEFIENWVPGIVEDGFKVVIHPTIEQMGLIIEAGQLESTFVEYISE